MKRLFVLTLLAACAGEPGQRTPADSAGTDTAPSAAARLPDPEPPNASRGQLALRSTGPIDLEGAWPARAGLCLAPPMLQVLVQQDLYGVILLLALPSSGSRTVSYPVTLAEQGIPEGPAAQAGAQRIVDGIPSSWQAQDGTVELYAWDGERVSGRFLLTLRDINTNQPSRIAGSFLGVDVAELPPGQCSPAG